MPITARTYHHRLVRQLLLLAMLPASLQAGDWNGWQVFSPALFNAARLEDRLVLLSLDAQWCGPCRNMRNTSYATASVRDTLNEHYLATRVDEEARPDLRAALGTPLLPVTVVLDPDGNVLARRTGMIADNELNTWLERLASTRRAEHEPALPAQQASIQQLDPESVLLDLELASNNDAQAARRARQQLDSASALIDDAFGGAYRLSLGADWKNPQREKTARTQWAYMLSYARACTVLKTEDYCAIARRVGQFVLDFLGAPGGAFYNAQDGSLDTAVDADHYFSLDRQARFDIGLPPIYKKRYASANGMLMEGLIAVTEATSDPSFLSAAEHAMDWLYKRRIYLGGGYRHMRKDTAGPYLVDTTYLSRAHLALYRTTHRTEYLKRAARAARFIKRFFRHPEGGFVSAVDDGSPIKPVRNVLENIRTVEFLLELAELGHDEHAQRLVEHGMRFLNSVKAQQPKAARAGIKRLLLITSTSPAADSFSADY